MSEELQYLILMTLVSGGVTLLLRSFPFLVLGGAKKEPKVLQYLGVMLPAASIAMLVVYCFAGHFAEPGVAKSTIGLAELLGGCVVIGLQFWKRNPLLSILAGTIVYMSLLRVFG